MNCIKSCNVILLIFQTYIISWDLNPEPDLYFYRVYVESEAHTKVYPVRNISFVFKIKNPSKVWVTALDYSLNESLPSKKFFLPFKTGVKMQLELFKQKYSIYPNPAKTYIVIDNADNVMVEIFNEASKLIKELFYRKNRKIPLVGFSSGIYFLRIDQKEVIKFIVLK